MRFPKPWAEFAARTRVPVSIALAAGACWAAQPTPGSLALGMPLAVAGVAVRAWAAGHLRKNQVLTSSGPYAHVRNPLYIGSLLGGIGFGVAANSGWLLAAIVIVFLAWFLPVVGEEEDHIRKILPGFRAYEARVGRFVPSLRPRRDSRTAFNFKLYLKNREYSALLGFAAFAAVLCLKLALA